MRRLFSRKRFGLYDFIKPSESVLNGETLKHSSLLVPDHIPRPMDGNQRDPSRMRQTCKIAAQVLQHTLKHVRVGITTLELDRIAHEKIISLGAFPSPLGYKGFPRSICTSINNVMCHGIPDTRPLKDGDLINIDVTCFKDGHHGDTSFTAKVGNVDAKGLDLWQVSYDAMMKGIEVCRHGVPISTIGKTIHDYVTSKGYTVSEAFCGHGIGVVFHDSPLVQHTPNYDRTIMKEGMTFTVEPVVCQGDPYHIIWPDKWTAVSIDGGRSCQFEHTILVEKDGCEILTQNG